MGGGGGRNFFYWNPNPLSRNPDLHRIIHRDRKFERQKIFRGFGLMIAIFRSVEILQALDKARTLIGETDTL
jgi:hypothetical protein